MEKVNLNGQILFSWDIHFACNYRCQYCWFYGEWQNLSLHNKYYPVSDLLRFWTNIYKKYGSAYIEIIGGEPFVYPNFTELIRELSQIHTVGITTNLSVDPADFIKKVARSDNVKVSPTFHPLFADFDRFINYVLLLKNAGMTGLVNYLAYPPQVEFINYYKEKFAEYGVLFLVMLFWGQYKGTSYPQGYTKEEKGLIEPHLGSRQGNSFQLIPKEVKGKLCRAGQVRASIRADGSVYRCGGSFPQLIGNFFCDDFELLNKPTPCESEFCPCNEWAGFLIDAKELTEAKTDEQVHLQISSVIELKPVVIKKEVSRNRIPPHRGFLTWDIHYACNYNCSYCNTPKPWNPPGSWDKDRDKVVYPGVDKWLKTWRDIYRKYGSCEIHITGGEPFTYPSFIELITHLSQIHTLEIITNLASDVNEIVKSVAPNRVRIGTTFHPEFVGLKEFLGKHVILRKNGFETWANYVAYPPQLEKMADYKKEFDKLRISFNIQPFMGHFQEREYPKGYTDSELSYLKECYTDNDIVNKKTIEWKTGTEYKNTKGKLCRMGQMYAKIYPVGDAYRCCGNPSRKIGNLVEGTFELLDEALPCECEQCHCWRCMLAGEEESWSQHWVIPNDSRKPADGLQDRYLENKKLNQFEIEQKKIKLDSRLTRLMVVLTGGCNISCIMCERKISNFILPKKTIEQIVEFFPYLDLMMWQGGEVFMVNYFKEFFQEASRYPHLTQEINTNGLLITEGWAEDIARANTRLIFSVDSTDKNIYEYIRKGAKFETLIRNITLLKEARLGHNKIDATDIVNVVVMRSNYQHLDSFIDFALQYGFRSINFMYMLGNICPEENIFTPLDNKAVNYLRRSIPKIIEMASAHGISVTYDFAPCLFGDGLSTPEDSPLTNGENLFCLLPWKSLFIDGSQGGKVYPECVCRVPVGDIFKESLGQIWNSENMCSYRKKIVNHELENWCNPNCIKGIVNKNPLKSL
jgi:MoaA/NifB/PqqE/SkfB family radical SAM enzyme